MLEALLDDLTNKLDALLCSRKRISDENKSLYELTAKLKSEQSSLRKKNQLVVTKTKTVIDALKKHYYE